MDDLDTRPAGAAPSRFFNTSVAESDDDIGLVESMSAIPPDVLATIFGVPADTLEAIPKNRDRVVIASKKKVTA